MTTLKQLIQHQKSITNNAVNPTQNLAVDLRQWLCEVLQKTQSFLIAHDDYELTKIELETYQAGLEKLQQGVPLAYVTGHQPFWLGDFVVNEHTLIPRADTEVLIETALKFLQNSLSKKTKQNPPNKSIKILDMGTGSGCIAISLAMSLAEKNIVHQVTATDFSLEALKVAQQNAERNKVQVEFLQGNWFSPFLDKDKFDIIVSNPPYIDPQDPHLADLTDEPITALVAQNHGLADIFTIIDGAKNHLVQGGLLAVEHGYDQAEKVRDYFTMQGFHQVQMVKDYGGNDRVTYGIFSQQPFLHTRVSVRGELVEP